MYEVLSLREGPGIEPKPIRQTVVQILVAYK